MQIVTQDKIVLVETLRVWSEEINVDLHLVNTRVCKCDRSLLDFELLPVFLILSFFLCAVRDRSKTLSMPRKQARSLMRIPRCKVDDAVNIKIIWIAIRRRKRKMKNALTGVIIIFGIPDCFGGDDGK